MTKPEDYAQPPEIHYQENAISYKNSSRLKNIQKELANCALDIILGTNTTKKLLLGNNNQPLLFLDLGCGTGMSGREISRRKGLWIGCDISKNMLMEISDNEDDESDEKEFENMEIATDEENTVFENINNHTIKKENSNGQEKNKYFEKNPLAKILIDISTELPFKPGTFDNIISISCIQWLFHNRSLHEAKKSFLTLFNSCKSVIRLNGKAVFQWYGSSNKEQTDILVSTAKMAGFYPEIIDVGAGRNKKIFLLLSTNYNKQKTNLSVEKKKKNYGVKAKIMKIKERHRRKGHKVGDDSKFTGRKRCKKFK